VRKVVELSDTRRNTAWQAAHAREFQAFVDETLSGLKVGANEPGRTVGTRGQIEARKEHNTYNRLRRCLCLFAVVTPKVCAGTQSRSDAAADPQCSA
jgi:hypothetical protein